MKCYSCKKETYDIYDFTLMRVGKSVRIKVCNNCRNIICHGCAKPLIGLTSDNTKSCKIKFCSHCIELRNIEDKKQEEKQKVKQMKLNSDYIKCKGCGELNDSKHPNGDIEFKYCKKCRIKYRDKMFLTRRTKIINTIPDIRGERKIF